MIRIKLQTYDFSSLVIQNVSESCRGWGFPGVQGRCRPPVREEGWGASEGSPHPGHQGPLRGQGRRGQAGMPAYEWGDRVKPGEGTQAQTQPQGVWAGPWGWSQVGFLVICKFQFILSYNLEQPEGFSKLSEAAVTPKLVYLVLCQSASPIL